VDFQAKAKSDLDFVVRTHDTPSTGRPAGTPILASYFITVTQGQLTLYEVDDPTCTPKVVCSANTTSGSSSGRSAGVPLRGPVDQGGMDEYWWDAAPSLFMSFHDPPPAFVVVSDSPRADASQRLKSPPAQLSTVRSPQPTAPISATFSSNVSSVSLTGLDVGSIGGFLLRGFDAVTGGSLIATQQVFGVTPGGVGELFALTINAPGIRRVDISKANAGFSDGTLFDNLVFDIAPAAVPEPATTALIALGLSSAALVRRRRQ